jgi:predicted nucleic acid-binding protein
VIVLDASAVIEILLQTAAGIPVAKRLLTQDSSLHAPHLLDVEVAQVLRRLVAQGELKAEQASQALQVLADLPIERYTHRIFLPRIWALRHNLTAYAAAYVALAEVLEATLVTRDARILRAPGHFDRVEVF